MSDTLSSSDREKAIQIDTPSVEQASSKETYSPPPAYALHRGLKNRHVAMIRYVFPISDLYHPHHPRFSALVVSLALDYSSALPQPSGMAVL